MKPTELAAAVLMLVGAVFALLGSVGLLRFPGPLSRMHAATKPITLGLGSVLLGCALVVDRPADAAQLVLVAALQFITAPVAAHMVGRSIHRTYEEARGRLFIDELCRPEVSDPG